MPANLENAAVATGLEKVSFHYNSKGQCQRMLKLLYSCTHFTLQLEAALADPQLPCPCLTPETGLGGNLVFNTRPPLFQGSRKTAQSSPRLTEILMKQLLYLFVLLPPRPGAMTSVPERGGLGLGGHQAFCPVA